MNRRDAMLRLGAIAVGAAGGVDAIATEGSSTAAPPVWKPDYQGRDREVVDYQEYRLNGIDADLRGPAVDLAPGRYFTCIGAAQTHGTLVPQPYPALLAQRLKLPVLNLGLPAAGPGYYAHQSAAIDYINRGRFLVLQVMSARAEANRYYEAAGWREQMRDRASGEIVLAYFAWQHLVQERPDELPAIVRESQVNWIESHRLLVSQIKVPIILFWFSHERSPDDRIRYAGASFNDLYWSGFPQFVDADCLPPVKAMCQRFVSCESRRNQGYRLVSRFSGKPVELDNGWLDPRAKGQIITHNHYYPSSEMHEDAAAALYETALALRDGTTSGS